MIRDAQRLMALKAHAGFKELQELWIRDITAIEAKRDNAAKRGNESAWRYYAGLEAGYKQAVMCLELELSRMDEDASVAEAPSEKIETLLAEARGGNS